MQACKKCTYKQRARKKWAFLLKRPKSTSYLTPSMQPGAFGSIGVDVSTAQRPTVYRPEEKHMRRSQRVFKPDMQCFTLRMKRHCEILAWCIWTVHCMQRENPPRLSGLFTGKGMSVITALQREASWPQWGNNENSSTSICAVIKVYGARLPSNNVNIPMIFYEHRKSFCVQLKEGGLFTSRNVCSQPQRACKGDVALLYVTFWADQSHGRTNLNVQFGK